MKKFLKISSVVMAMLLLLSTALLFASCKKDEAGGETDIVGTVSTDEALPPLEIKDLQQLEVKFLWPQKQAEDNGGAHFKHNELVVEVSQGDVIDDAVVIRNAAVEAAYNVKLTVAELKYNQIDDQISTEVKAGTTSYSAVASTIKALSPVALEGIFVNWSDLSYYDEEQPWWNHDLMDDFAIAKSRLFASGDIIYSDDFYPYAVYANADVAEEYGIEENFYDLVQNKQWTLEKFHELAVKVSDGHVTAQTWSKDSMNGAVINPNFAKAVYYSTGHKLVKFNKQGYAFMDMELKTAQPILEKIISVIHTDGAAFNADNYTWEATNYATSHANLELKLLNDKKTLFVVEELILAERIASSDSGANFQLLPMPLYDENSEEYISVLNDAVVLAIPTAASRIQDVSLVLSAMSRESVNTLTPAFFDTVLAYRYMQDAQSLEVLRLLLDSTVAPDVATISDWGNMFGNADVGAGEFKRLAMQGSTDLSSAFDQNLGDFKANINDYNEKIDAYLENMK